MPVVGPRCHELRIVGVGHSWRIIYRADADAIIIAGVFAKKTPETPWRMMEISRQRLQRHDTTVEEE